MGTLLLLGLAALAGVNLPPVHPILVNFTAALIPVSLICDILARWTGKESLRSTAWWTLCFGTSVTPLTALTGWVWMRSMQMDHPTMTIHMWLGTALAVTLIPLMIWRGRIHQRNGLPGKAYIGLLVLLVSALVVQGHIGGSMSFALDSVSESAVPATAGGGDSNRQWRDHIDLVPEPASQSLHGPDTQPAPLQGHRHGH